MSISAAQVKELRERTGAGMMECKKALVETGGDLDEAIKMMRTSGLAKADKKAGRVAAEGVIIIETEAGKAALVEVNCETDFVAGGDDFKAFAGEVAAAVLAANVTDSEAISALTLGGGQTVDERRRELVAKIGEKITVRRAGIIENSGPTGVYLHGARIGVVVALEGGDEELARDIAMHIAASNPVCVAAEDVPAGVLAKEREIIKGQSAQSGKPAEIIEKMVDGRMRKYLGEITLLGQPFVKDPDLSVGKLLSKAGASVTRFVRFEVGEGIDRKDENFADEVMAQVRGE